MNRARVVPALLAAVATIGVGLPLRVLFDPPLWMGPSSIAIGAVALTGMALRRLTRFTALVGLGQSVAGLWILVLLLLRDTTWYALPALTTARAFGDAVVASVEAIRDQAAPVVTTTELAVTLSVILTLIAVVVDVTAVTLRSPAAAAIPLLAAYIALASNSGTGLGLPYFLVPAAAWLGLLGHDGMERISRWATTVARPRGGDAKPVGPGVLGWARGIALVALATAVVLPSAIPHLPPTFLASGLGRADTGGSGEGSGASGMVLSDSLDVARNLGERSTEPILRYRTDDPTPPPLRVDALTEYSDGVWQPSSAQVFNTEGQFPPSAASEDIDRRTPTAEFEGNDLRSPQLAVPGVPLTLDLPAEAWRIDAHGIIRAQGSHAEYAVRYEEVTPTAEQLRESNPLTEGTSETLAIDAASSDYVAQVLDQIAPAGLEPAETAWRIQAYLRSAQFTYALDLASPVAVDNQGRAVPEDPLSQFLATRRGYCIQYSTAMVMMARHRGIPARVGIGFLPGTLGAGDTWTVRANDAHAWAELLFPGIGWVRFEPTPGTRTGAAPGWTTDSTTTAASTSTASPTTAPPTEAVTDPLADGADQAAADAESSWLARVGQWVVDQRWALLALLGLALTVAATPSAAWLRRRIALRRARDDAERIEVLWESLLDRLSDLGAEPGAGETPRQAAATLSDRALLDAPSKESLGQVVATLERARYAPPNDTVTDVQHVAAATKSVAQRAISRRRLTARTKARLWPREGRRAWSEAADAVLSRILRD